MFRLLFGFFCAILGFGLGLMMQVGPHDAATNFCIWFSPWRGCAQALPTWFDEWAWLLPTSLVAASPIFIFWAPAEAAMRSLRRNGGRVPLIEAARYFYEAMDGTEIGKTARTTYGNSPNDRLGYFIDGMLAFGTPMAGKQPPSQVFKPLPTPAPSTRWVHDTNTIVDDDHSWEDVQVNRRDLKSYLNSLKALDDRLSGRPTAPADRFQMTMGFILLLVSLAAFIVAMSMIAQGSPQSHPQSIYRQKSNHALAKRHDENARPLLYPEPKVTPAAKASKLAITYVNECNADHIESLYRRSYSPLVGGMDRKKVSIHEFYIGVQNKVTDKTLRNVRMVVDSCYLGKMGYPINKELRCERSAGSSVDIPPLGIDYFYLGEGWDISDAGMFHFRIMDRASYDQLFDRLNEMERPRHGFYVHWADGNIHPLLKNNDIRMELNIFADDTMPLCATLRINTKERIEVIVTEIRMETA